MKADNAQYYCVLNSYPHFPSACFQVSYGAQDLKLKVSMSFCFFSCQLQLFFFCSFTSLLCTGGGLGGASWEPKDFDTLAVNSLLCVFIHLQNHLRALGYLANHLNVSSLCILSCQSNPYLFFKYTNMCHFLRFYNIDFCFSLWPYLFSWC